MKKEDKMLGNHWKKLDKKLDDSGPTNRLLKKAIVTREDIGKIFYTDPTKRIGNIINYEDFLKMNPDDIGGWVRIGELDVNS